MPSLSTLQKLDYYTVDVSADEAQRAIVEVAKKELLSGHISGQFEFAFIQKDGYGKYTVVFVKNPLAKSSQGASS